MPDQATDCRPHCEADGFTHSRTDGSSDHISQPVSDGVANRGANTAAYASPDGAPYLIPNADANTRSTHSITAATLFATAATQRGC